MHPELAKLKRKPLMLPLIMPIVLLAVVGLFIVWVLDARTSTVVIMVPHAETETAADGDPILNAAGRERAARLASMLGQSGQQRGVDVVFASDLKRTQQTVMPLAQMLGLAVNAVSGAAWNDLGGRILREHNGEMALVVGDPMALPVLVDKLSGEQVTVGEGEYDVLFIVYLSRLSKPRLVKLRY